MDNLFDIDTPNDELNEQFDDAQDRIENEVNAYYAQLAQENADAIEAEAEALGEEIIDDEREIDADDETDDADDEIEQGVIEPPPPDPNEYQQGTFFGSVPLPEIRGKSLEALAYSRQVRDDIVRLFRGRPPSSVMLADKESRDANDLATGTYEESGQLAQKRAKGETVAKLPKTFEVSGRGAASGALSKFPQNIGRACVLLYSNPGDTVVDPFAGHNSRMDLCVAEGRHYIGQDLSHKFHAFNVERAKELRIKYPEIHIELYQGTSEKMFAKDESGDFTITSPPYYDIEYYGDEPEQLGQRGTYDDFMQAMQKVSDENFRTLKPGAFAAWFINDFRRNGKFYAYHVDIMNMLVKSGFVMWDIMITDFGRTFRDAFVRQIMQQKILPKRHEYGIIVRKPGWKKETASKEKAPVVKKTRAKKIKGATVPTMLPDTETAPTAHVDMDIFASHNAARAESQKPSEPNDA